VLEGAEVTLGTMRPLIYSENQRSRQPVVNEWMAVRGYVPFAPIHPDYLGSRSPGDFLFVPAELKRIHLSWFSVEPTTEAGMNFLVTGLSSAQVKNLESKIEVLSSSGHYEFTVTGTRSFRTLPRWMHFDTIHGFHVSVYISGQLLMTRTQNRNHAALGCKL
jgi:hypothetical protein